MWLVGGSTGCQQLGRLRKRTASLSSKPAVRILSVFCLWNSTVNTRTADECNDDGMYDMHTACMHASTHASTHCSLRGDDIMVWVSRMDLLWRFGMLYAAHSRRNHNVKACCNESGQLYMHRVLCMHVSTSLIGPEATHARTKQDRM